MPWLLALINAIRLLQTSSAGELFAIANPLAALSSEGLLVYTAAVIPVCIFDILALILISQMISVAISVLLK